MDRNNLNYSTVLRNLARLMGSSLLKVTCWKNLLSHRLGPTLGTHSHWLGTACGTNALVDPEGQHLGLSVSYAPCSRKSKW